MAGVAYCTCLGRASQSFTNRGDIWVCATCRMPTRMAFGKLTDKDVTLLRGGPRHDEVWTNDELMNGREDASDVSWMADYRRTDEVLVGSETGRSARVWVHVDLLEKKL